MREYSALTLTRLENGARVAEPMTPGRVTLDDPAFSVMTDLREVSAATTRPDESIDAAVAAAAARHQLALGGAAAAQAIIEQALEREWSPGLIALYGECASADALPQIERAEKWLRSHARDPALLLALGKLCMRQSLWGKAQSYIEASLALEPTHDGHMTLAALMESLGKPQEAVQHFRRSAELAG